MFSFALPFLVEPSRQIAASENRRLGFQKRGQLFINTHNDGYRRQDARLQRNRRHRSLLLLLSLSVENLKPLSTLLHPNAPAVIRTRHVLAFGSLLNRRFVRIVDRAARTALLFA